MSLVASHGRVGKRPMVVVGGMGSMKRRGRKRKSIVQILWVGGRKYE